MTELRASVEELQGELTLEAAKRWAETLSAAWAQDDEHLAKLTPEQIRDLVVLLGLLDGPSAVALLRRYFAKPDLRRAAPDPILAELARRGAEYGPRGFCGDDPVVTEALLEEIERALQETSSRSAMEDLARAWLALENLDAARTWVERAARGALEGPDAPAPTDAARQAQLLIDTESSPDSRLWLKACQRMADAASFAPSFDQARCLAWTVKDEIARHGLDGLFPRGDGQTNLGLAKLLAWAHQLAGREDAWRSFIEERLEAAPESERVHWLAAKAYSESVSMREPVIQQNQRAVGLLRAQAAAGTDQERWTVLQERLEQLSEGGHYDQALGLLDQAKGQWPELSGRLEERDRTLLQQAQSYWIAISQQERRSAEQRLTARLAHLQTCAEQARTAGDQDALLKAEEAIHEVQAQLPASKEMPQRRGENP